MANWKKWFERVRPRKYARKRHLILLNGLAEQNESWYRNIRYWSRFFEVHTPKLFAYEGEVLQRRIKEDKPITIDFFVDQLYTYLDQFVQDPPYHLVSSSLGGKVAVEFAVKYPQLVDRIVLICPSGMGDVEKLPIIEGVRRSDYEKIIDSVFYRKNVVEPDVLRYYKRCFENRRWKLGLIRTVRGTNDHTVRSKLKHITKETLFISGQNDQIVDSLEGNRAAAELQNGHYLLLPNCGHAPQLEKPWLVNRLVVHFLTHSRPSSQPKFLQLVLNRPRRIRS